VRTGVGHRLLRDGAIFLTGLLLLIAAAFAIAKLQTAVATPGAIGYDFSLYLNRTRSWQAGTGFYLPSQTAGVPYPAVQGDSFYPPVLMVLLIPFAAGVPAFLWWVLPLALTAGSLVQIRPAWWAYPILAAVLAYPRTWIALICGNPSMWAIAFLVAGLAWRWPAALVPLKLTLAPFALIGVRARSWWIAAAGALLLCIPFGSTWLDWATSMVNVRMTPDLGPDYVLGEWPIALALLVVGLFGSRRAVVAPGGAAGSRL